MCRAVRSVCFRPKAKNNKEPSASLDLKRRVAKVQIDCMFMSGDNETCKEPRTQLVILLVVGVDDGAASATAPSP